MACERQRVAKSGSDVVQRYMDLVPRDAALYLEDPLRVPKPEGWTLEPLMAAAEEYYDLRLAYPTKEDGFRPTRRNQPSNSDRQSPQEIGPLPVGADPKTIHQIFIWDNDKTWCKLF